MKDDKTENKISIDDFLSPLYELAEEIEKENNEKDSEHPKE